MQYLVLLNNCKQLDLQILGLEEGTQTQFRVRAQNATGLGEPSSPTPVTTIAPTPEAPKVLGISVRDLRVRAGMQYEIKVPYSGFPWAESAARAQWRAGRARQKRRDSRRR